MVISYSAPSHSERLLQLGAHCELMQLQVEARWDAVMNITTIPLRFSPQLEVCLLEGLGAPKLLNALL